MDKGDVFFLNRPITKLFRQRLVYLLVLSDDDKPRGIFVETVDNADRSIAGSTPTEK